MDVLTALFTVIAGILTNRVLDILKQIPWLSDEEKSKISGPLADVLAFVLAGGVGWLVTLLAGYLGFEVNPVLVAGGAYPIAVAWHEVRNRKGGHKSSNPN